MIIINLHNNSKSYEIHVCNYVCTDSVSDLDFDQGVRKSSDLFSDTPGLAEGAHVSESSSRSLRSAFVSKISVPL